MKRALLLLAACGSSEPARSTTTLAISITADGVPVGARVLLWAEDGEPVRIGRLDLYNQRQGASACPIAPGVIGSWNGLVVARGGGEVPIGKDACNPSPAIPYGTYKVWAWRGVEYERWEGEIDLRAKRGRVALDIALARAWTPHGTLAADMHVHAQASNDSTLPNPQRVIAQAAAGIQVIGLSDHNTNADVDREIRELGLDDVIASVAGNELTSELLHANVYPVVIDNAQPRGGSPAPEALAKADATRMFQIARGFPGRPIIQVNHPRFRYAALYDTAGWNGVTWPPPFSTDFDAVEVVAGYSAFNTVGDRRFDDSARDYFTFLDHGHVLTPMGNSDTHDLNWVLDGTARTYVFVDEPKPFDEAAFIAALRAHRTVATTGPWLDVEVKAPTGTVGPGQSLPARGRVAVDITLAQAAFVKAERVTVWVGGQAPRVFGTERIQTEIEVGTEDTWLCVTADGDTPMPKEITGTYQQDKWKRPGVTPFAITAAILIDADGDGRWKRGEGDYLLTPFGSSSQ